MVDLLGVDKLASSMALTMVAQAAGLLLGPTISGTHITVLLICIKRHANSVFSTRVVLYNVDSL